MQGRFVYVFCKEDRDRLLSSGLNLLKSDDAQGIYVFDCYNIEKKEELGFSDDITFVFSNTLTF